MTDQARTPHAERLERLVSEAKYPVKSPEHALFAGFVWGVAVDHGIDLVPEVDEEGNYTASFLLNLPEPMAGVTVRLIVEAPEVTP